MNVRRIIYAITKFWINYSCGNEYEYSISSMPFTARGKLLENLRPKNCVQ